MLTLTCVDMVQDIKNLLAYFQVFSSYRVLSVIVHTYVMVKS